FYDVLFLMSFSGPDYDYLEKKCGISDLQKLKLSVKNTLEQVDLNTKMQDFKHLLFNSDNTKRILSLPDFFEQL
ncbi:hypothetical protein RZS08_64555, partial [Arthrospira platensis SPKY1]|nr:hypothetical protein [Arthrospira platensis SPKY1]